MEYDIRSLGFETYFFFSWKMRVWYHIMSLIHFISDILWLQILGTSNHTADNYSKIGYCTVFLVLLHFNYKDWVSNYDLCRVHDFVFTLVCVFICSVSLSFGWPKLFTVNWGSLKTWVEDKYQVFGEITFKFHKT